LNFTAWLIVFLVFALSIYDIYAALRWGYHGTISYDILTAAQQKPVIAFAAGILCGHLFWPQGDKP
jgi:hypothetical protein